MTAPTPDSSPAPTADLARLVATALAHRADPEASRAEVAEVRAITDAMVRLLIGAPLRSDGKLTIVALAAEAGLRRNKLTHKHTGLKDLFNALVKAHEQLTTGDAPSEDGRARKLTADLKRVRAERDEQRALAQQLARIVQVLEVENDRLKTTKATLEERLATEAGVTDLSRRRPRPPTTPGTR